MQDKEYATETSAESCTAPPIQHAIDQLPSWVYLFSPIFGRGKLPIGWLYVRIYCAEHLKGIEISGDMYTFWDLLPSQLTENTNEGLGSLTCDPFCEIKLAGQVDINDTVS